MPFPRLTPADIVGVAALLPAPSVPGADHWSCAQSVDLSATASMVETVAGAGLSLLLTGGSFGEGATLTWRESEALTACIADSLRGRGHLFAGATTLNTRDTVALGRRLVDRGATGLFLGRPMWMALDGPAIVRFYADVAEALPGVPIVVYDNEFAFKGKIDTATYAALSRNPAVVATKHIGGPSVADDLRAVEGRMRVLPVDSAWHELAVAFPDEALACWSGNAADGPEPLAVLADAIRRRDRALSAHVCERMRWAQGPMFPGGKVENLVDYNIPIAHGRLQGSGLVRSGPPRPPYLFAPEDYWEGGRETGRRWASLRTEFAVPKAA